MTIARRYHLRFDINLYYHCVTPCVRRAFISGRVQFTGRNFCRNRLSDTTNGVNTCYSYDYNDRLLIQGVTSFTYDANGSTISEADGLNLNTYSYDSRNKPPTNSKQHTVTGSLQLLL